MHVLLCNERFLFRFGVDRVLLLYGQELHRRGHKISVMANRLDRGSLTEFVSNIVEVPSKGDYIDLNQSVADWIEDQWDDLFETGDVPDAVVIGGWPFLAAIPVFRSRGVRVLFSDHGVVPLDNYEGGHRQVLERLIDLRRRYLPECDHVMAISDFIADTQSRFEAGGAPVSVNLNGADHMDSGVWSSGEKVASTAQADIITRIKKLRAKSVPLIINLGRWEPGCYKNSEAIFAFVDEFKAAGHDCRVLILADEVETEIPAKYKARVIPIGFPSDEELQAVMATVDLGLSVSLWEGFNLPLAEMQWLGKAVLCFDVGAHPEVVVDPWYLCTAPSEMVEKAGALLAGKGLAKKEWSDATKRFQDAFKWSRTIDRLEAALEAMTTRSLQIVVDITNAALDPANSGVIRVTRRLCRHLQDYCDPIFVIWDRSLQAYVYPDADGYRRLSAFNGPQIDEYHVVSPPGERVPFDVDDMELPAAHRWLMLPETVMEADGRHIREFARENDLRLCAIFYDAIPLLRPDIVWDSRIRENHASYMRGLASCDLVIPISEFSADCLGDFWADNGLSGCRVATDLLPGEFGAAGRNLPVQMPASKTSVDMLCVSTLEPRKNHVRVLHALEEMGRRNPAVDWTFTMIGNRYAGGDDIARAVEEACASDSRIRWLGVVDDETLARAYDDCDLTVYASEIEGFGMPILESIWHGKPVLCHSGGVMAELAEGGGALTVDMTNVDAISRAVERLATNKALRSKLQAEARDRELKSWDDYTHQFLTELLLIGSPEPSNQRMQEDRAMFKDVANVRDWPSLLYKDCLTAEWQMNDSERLGMMAILARLQPSCAVEVGTYRGGSLSLISQYVDCVYSIDIDETIPEKYAFIENARFFTGDSAVVLPKLLAELDKREIPVEFVLIDGDHSADGVRRDIEIMLDYKPTRPMVMMMHDGFNPECRRGMLEARWARSPYLQYVDLDFIPGRIIEGGGGIGEMWGGLALAYFAPEPREGDVRFMTTSQGAYERAREVALT